MMPLRGTVIMVILAGHSGDQPSATTAMQIGRATDIDMAAL
jgi:hypothetical protein